MMSDNERGSGLVIAILTVVALFAVGATLVFITRTDINISRHQTQYVEALFVAEAGVEETLHRLSLRNPTIVNVNGIDINAAIGDDSIPYDPNWTARVFLCTPGNIPAAGAGEYHTCTVQDEASWLEYSVLDDQTQALTIEHKWIDLDDDGLREDGEIVRYDASKYPPENFDTGRPVEVITLTGRHATAAREVLVEAIRTPFNINAKAALFCNEGVDVRGNVSVCGHDHSIDTPHYHMIPECKDYEYCSNRTNCLRTGCVTGIMTTGDEIDRRGSTDLAGFPGPMDTSSTNQFLTLAETLGISQDLLDQILAGADWHEVGFVDPQDGVTYVDNAGGSEVHWNGGVGTGLLYVTGDFRASGNLIFKGLIYVEGDFSITGTIWVLGAVVVRGRSEYAFSGGSPTILFSSEALNYYLAQSLDYIRLGWKETSGL
jgi:hypothetical protein